jgi:membrane protein
MDQAGNFVRYLWARISHDRIHVNAGYLAYITLLSLVPMLTVLFSVLSAVTLFHGAGEVIQTFIITHFVPAAGEAVNQALKDFVSNTDKMTIFGGAFLFIIALTLISNVDRTLNYIWRIKNKRRWVFSFSMYWMVLTLGPVLVGTSIAVTSYIASFNWVDEQAFSGISQLLLRWLPFLLSLVAFTGLYLFVPNKKIAIRHALAGALVAAILFEIGKRGFAFYMTHFPSYQLIYGALAAIPILFVWVYLSWLIVLLGAELTASFGEYSHWSEIEDVVHSGSLSGESVEDKRERNDRIDSEGE